MCCKSCVCSLSKADLVACGRHLTLSPRGLGEKELKRSLGHPFPHLPSSTQTTTNRRGEFAFAGTSGEEAYLPPPPPPPGGPHQSVIKMFGVRGRAEPRPAYQGGIYLRTVHIISHQTGLWLSPLAGRRAKVTAHSSAYLTNRKQDLKDGSGLHTARRRSWQGPS